MAYEQLAYSYENGRIQSLAKRGADGIRSDTIFHYDDKHRLVAATTKTSDGSLVRERRISYDDAGRIVERIVCDPIGCFDKEIFSYDSAGRRVRTNYQEAHDAGRGIRETVVIPVDATGSEQTEIGLDGSVVRRSMFRDQLDALGNWSRAVGFGCPPSVTRPSDCNKEGESTLRLNRHYPPD